MGNRVTSSIIKRPVKNWNIENRAQTFIEKQDKPTAAPRHPTTQPLLDEFNKEHPELYEAQKTKNEKLATMLHGMVVKPDKFPEIRSQASKEHRPALDKVKAADNEFGYLEPAVIRHGRCSIRQAIQFLGDHYTDPARCDSALIADKYKLDKERVRHILKYYQVFHVQMPGSAAEASRSRIENLGATYRPLMPDFFKKKQISASADKDADKDADSQGSQKTTPVK